MITLFLIGLFSCAPTHDHKEDLGRYDYYHINASQDENPVVHRFSGILYIWVPTHKYKGEIIKGYWKQIQDPTNIENYVWMPGHYEGRGKNKIYVTAHWERIR